jgi:Asp-tRNA(Asn)/Glu-tRNA(Gln) amidotransferase A subunit family amidase
VSPSRHCATTGLRPTYGRVSRHGAMALSWSMDKLGPMCRSVEDCAIVFDAIYGPDGQDLSVVDYPFNWNAERPLSELRIGYVPAAFERSDEEEKAQNDKALDVLKSLGVDLIEVELPDFPYHALRRVLSAEAAAAFDELTRSNQDDLMVRQGKDAWPSIFRAARLMPAVEYIQAQRLRTQLMQSMAKVMQSVDVYVTPAGDVTNLILTNLTGHPTAVLPNAYPDEGVPVNSLTFTGNLYAEADTLRVAKAFQDATDYHQRQPDMSYGD